MRQAPGARGGGGLGLVLSGGPGSGRQSVAQLTRTAYNKGKGGERFAPFLFVSHEIFLVRPGDVYFRSGSCTRLRAAVPRLLQRKRSRLRRTLPKKRAVVATKRTASRTATASPSGARPTSERYKEIQQALASKGYLKSEPLRCLGRGFRGCHAAVPDRPQTGPRAEKLTAASLIDLGLGPHPETSVPAQDRTIPGAPTVIPPH